MTGAASGIGRATALLLAEHGARLVLCDLDQTRLEETAGEVLQRSECLLVRRVDVASREQMTALAEEVHARVPALDVLVNNAGVGLTGGLLSLSLEDWEWILSINLWGVIHGCHLFVPRMAARGRGHVVNVSSVLGYLGQPQMIGYVTSKFGVLGLSESLRAELAPRGVGVTAICPGIIDTGITTSTRLRGVPDEQAARERVVRLYRGRGYGPEKVAAAILDAIRHDRAVVPVSPEAWALYLLKRLAPGLVGPLGRLMSRSAGI